MSSSELREAAGAVLVGGFSGTHIDDALARSLQQGELGGIIVFARNLDNLQQVRRLCEDAQAAAGARPLWLAVDQEGGRVQRLGARVGATAVPAMADCAAAGEARVRAASKVMACELSALGFNLNLAPVLDVNSNPKNPIIASRAFSNEAQTAASMAVAFAEEHLRLGMGICGKHFPGHGDTDQDSHLTLPRLEHRRERLDAVELLPFRAAIAAHFPMLMSAHVLVPALDTLPATLSPVVIRRLLREELGFKGVVVSDDMEMQGIAAHWTIAEAAVMAVEAGVDLLLVCGAEGRWRQAHQALLSKAGESKDFARRLLQAAQHVHSTRQQVLEAGVARRLRSPRHESELSRVGSDAHRDALRPALGGACGWCDDEGIEPFLYSA